MTGVVIPLARTEEDLMLHAQQLALRVGTPMAEVYVFAWAGHTEQSVVAAWDDYRDAVRALEALALGKKVWQQFYDDDVCRGQDHAIELKDAEVRDAWRYLHHPPRRA